MHICYVIYIYIVYIYKHIYIHICIHIICVYIYATCSSTLHTFSLPASLELRRLLVFWLL